MNILIKLTCLIGLVIAPILGGHTEDGMAMNETRQEVSKEIRVEMNAGDDENAKAVVTVTTTENGETKTEERIIEGSTEEVKAKVEAMKDVDAKIELKGKKVVKEIIEEVENN